MIPSDSHVRAGASRANNGGVRLLRRGYNFVDGSDGLGRLDAGLFFLAYERDPRNQFIPMQTRAGQQATRMNEYIQHIGSALFAVPAGRRRRASTSARRCSPDPARRSPSTRRTAR